MADLTRQKTSETIYISDHEGDVSAASYLEEILQEEPPCATFRYLWGPDSDGSGGPGVADPTTIDISFAALSEYDDCGPTWRTSVHYLTADLIASLRNNHTGMIEGDREVAIARTVVRSLRKEADILENRISGAPWFRVWL